MALNKRKRETPLELQDMYDAGRDMMHRAEKAFGAIMEETHFSEMLDIWAQVALTAWTMPCSTPLDCCLTSGDLEH